MSGIIPLKYATAGQIVPFGVALAATDGDTENNSLTIANTDIKIWKAGATSLVSKNSGGATNMSNGVYYATFDATDTNTIGPLVAYIHVSPTLVLREVFFVYAATTYTALFGDGTTYLPVDAVAVSGDSTAADNLEADYDGTGYSKANSSTGINTTTANIIADHVWRRDLSNVEASSYGDTIVFQSPYTAICSHTNKVAFESSTLTVYQTDGITAIGGRVATTSESVSVVTEFASP